MKNRVLFLSLCLIVLLFSACQKAESGKEMAKLDLKFVFQVARQPFIADTLLYVNAAGNRYEINEIKFFISDISLQTIDNKIITINESENVHYVDSDLPGTLTWTLPDSLPVTRYQSITFRLGLAGQKNTTHYFVNPPESNMAWPATLGGGYHYLMLNGHWLAAGTRTPFNFHAGVTLDENNEPVEHTAIITLQNPGLQLQNNHNQWTVNVNLNNWFSTPIVFDFNYFGGSIMTNVEAQEAIQANSQNVFSIDQ